MKALDKLCVIWTTADPEAAMNMALMYAKNAKLKGWWETVRLIVWGPSQNTLLEDGDLQEEISECLDAEVEVWACKACSDRYEASEDLEDLGLEVFHVGEELTKMIKEGWSVLTV